MWQDITEVTEDRVRFELRYRMADGSSLVSRNELRFRTQAELSDALAGTGFVVEHVYGDWDHHPVGPDTPELIFVAARGS
jgi:hypothetical protein